MKKNKMEFLDPIAGDEGKGHNKFKAFVSTIHVLTIEEGQNTGNLHFLQNICDSIINYVEQWTHRYFKVYYLQEKLLILQRNL